MSSKLSIPASDDDEEVTTFDARVKWAITNRELFIFKDNDEAGARIEEIYSDDDDEEVMMAQQGYERRYCKAKAKLEAHKKKEKEEHEARTVEEFFTKNPELRGKYQIIKEPEALPKTSKSVVETMPSSSKRRASVISVHPDDEPIDTARPKKSRILMVSKGGALFPIPCDHCQEHGYEYQTQITVENACYPCTCNKSKLRCSLLNNPVHPRGANRGQAMQKTEVEADDSADDVETEGETKPRRSTCIANEVSGNDNVVAQAIRSQTIELANMTALLGKIDERLNNMVGYLHQMVY